MRVLPARNNRRCQRAWVHHLQHWHNYLSQRAFNVQPLFFWHLLRGGRGHRVHRMRIRKVPVHIGILPVYLVHNRDVFVDWRSERLHSLQPGRVSSSDRNVRLPAMQCYHVSEHGRPDKLRRLRAGHDSADRRDQPVHRLHNWKVCEPGREPAVRLRRLYSRVVPVLNRPNRLCHMRQGGLPERVWSQRVHSLCLWEVP